MSYATSAALLLLAVATVRATTASAQSPPEGELVITAIYDGPRSVTRPSGSVSSGLPKGVELTATGPIADLSAYQIIGAFNGNPPPDNPNQRLRLSGSATAGQRIYVASEIAGAEAYFGFAPDFPAASRVSVNGNDAMVLYRDGVVHDVYGEIGVDGAGTAWDYEDGLAVRDPGLGPSVTFEIDDWIVSKGGLADCETNCTCGIVISAEVNCAVPLPASLTHFSAAPLGPDVARLTWATAREEGSDYFAVEHSGDGTSFGELDRVAAAGLSNGPRDYSSDYEVGAGDHYFRLRQVDLDGTYAYSETVALTLPSERSWRAIGTGPGSTITLATPEAVDLRVVDLAGRTLTWLAARPGQVELPLEGLPAGMYLLTDGRRAVRFVR